MASKMVAIHQPNFFPWLGYFNKIARADLFLVMDNVQFPRTNRGTWLNRVRLLVNGQPAWVTMPVVRAYHGLRAVKEMHIDSAAPWRSKLLKTIEASYKRTPFFKDVFPVIQELIENETDSLADYNLSSIISLAKTMGLDASKLVLGSSLNADGNATDLLISMLKAVGGDAYLCGGGSGGYQEDEKFAQAGIELVYQNFEHPLYPQATSQEFVSGLSIIDALMNCGFKRTAEIVSAP